LCNHCQNSTHWAPEQVDFSHSERDLDFLVSRETLKTPWRESSKARGNKQSSSSPRLRKTKTEAQEETQVSTYQIKKKEKKQRVVAGSRRQLSEDDAGSPASPPHPQPHTQGRSMMPRDQAPLWIPGAPRRPPRSHPRSVAGDRGGARGRGEGAKGSPGFCAVILLRNSLSSEAGEHPAARALRTCPTRRGLPRTPISPHPHPVTSLGSGVPVPGDHTGWRLNTRGSTRRTWLSHLERPCLAPLHPLRPGSTMSSLSPLLGVVSPSPNHRPFSPDPFQSQPPRTCSPTIVTLLKEKGERAGCSSRS
jgi:hypothetical protein